MNLNQVVENLQKNKAVESIMQFGSSLTKKDFRDVDLCIFTTRRISLKEKLRVIRELPEKFDISFYDDLSLNLKHEVMSKGKVLYSRNYYKLLKEGQYVEREYPRFAVFLEDYHKKRMAEL